MTQRAMPTTNGFSEPACFERMVRVHPLTISAVFKKGGEVGQGYVLNLSLGGVFLTTDAPFEIGERFRLRFFLPLQVGQVDAEAIVRWRTSDLDETDSPRTGFGIEFVAVEAPSRANIGRFIDKFVEIADQLES